MFLNFPSLRQIALSSAIAVCLFPQVGNAKKYYSEESPFHPAPAENANSYNIIRFGPVGLGLQLIQPAFTIKVTNVEPGSPADKTGKFKKGQIIDSVNGESLQDRDPRIILGEWITKAEAKDGVLKMSVREKAGAAPSQITVKIPALGAYSKTWPENCPKSDRIVRRFADFLAEVDKPNHGAALFLLSTGEQKDLEVVGKWYARELPDYKYPWDIGYAGVAVCEYYLRTGDKTVLPAIEKMAGYLKDSIYNGGWAGRGGAPFRYMAGGHLNAAGMGCVTYLLLAKECGVKVDEETLQSSLKHFYRFAGKGNLAYGDGLPEGGFVDNGKTIGLAFVMNAAANLTPEGENSIYAKARDISATKSLYSTSWLFHGHTGGGIGELWRGRGMEIVKEERPDAYRSFMEGRQWMYELARTWDGAFGWVSGWNVSYTQTGHGSGRTWGNYIPLIYTQHLKNLRIDGAKAGKFSKTYQLPKRPWGTAADDIFLSMEPGEYAPGKKLDLSKERFETHASKPLLALFDTKDFPDEQLLAYAHHIDQGIRASAARVIVKRGKTDLAISLLKSSDPRGRQAGLSCLTGMFKGKGFKPDQTTPEMFELAATMIADPEESWWVKERALAAMEKAPADLVAKHSSAIYPFLDHEEWWLRKSAIRAVTPISTTEEHYERVLTKIGQMIISNQRAVAVQPVSGIVAQVSQASPKIQAYAEKVLGDAYINFPNELTAPGNQDLSNGVTYLLDALAAELAKTSGGLDKLFTVATQRFPENPLPQKDVFLAADPKKMSPEIKNKIRPALLNEIIPEYIKKARKSIEHSINLKEPTGYITKLIQLYENAGITDYRWEPYGPDRREIVWDYYSFDGDNGELINKGASRYRKVTWPKGMEDWFKPGFEPKKHNWKTGYAPFGATAGELRFKGRCMLRFCECDAPLKTLWEKEVLMMRAEITLPPMDDGYAYRIVVSGRSHVNTGDGSDVWIDGVFVPNHNPRLAPIPRTPRRAGGRPCTLSIKKEMREHFADNKIVLAATGFMTEQGGETKNRQSFWLERMKLPVLPKAE